MFGGEEAGQYGRMKKADLFLDNAELSFTDAFGRAYEYGTDEQKKKLEKLSNDYSDEMKKASGVFELGKGKENTFVDIMSPVSKQQVIDNSLKKLQEITEREAPKVFELSEDFAMGEAAKTFGNLAAKSYDKFGKKAPILAIENMFQGMAFSRAEDMRKLIQKANMFIPQFPALLFFILTIK